MTSRERVLTTLSHRQPDRVPVDFGGCSTTGMHVSCVAALREYYGLEKRPVRVHEPHQMLGWIDEDLQDAMGIDVAGVLPRKTAYGYVNENWKEWRTQDGQVVLVGEGFRTTTDPEGNVLIYPQDDLTAPPSGKMPKGGVFFDSIIRQQPIDEDRLDPMDNTEEFGLFTDEDVAWFVQALRQAASTGRATMAKVAATAFGDIAHVPGPALKYPKGIRDIEEWYISTRARRDYVHAVFARQCEIGIQNMARINAAIGDDLDVVYVCGTDFGTQTSSFCSVPTFRELYLPYYKQVNRWISANTRWRAFKHSCGAVEKFLESFIEAGFQIVNPVQCSAAGMEPEKLKANYGDRLVFWGGGVDTQKTLPFGSPAEVRRQVLERCEIFARDGGFVFNTVHNIQAHTPVENITAMIDAVREFSGLHKSG